MQKRVFINNQIRANEIRLIDETGKQLGIFNLDKAIAKAKEKGLDLIQITEKVKPPVCKIGDFGKYLYRLEKKEKHQKRSGELKNIRLSFGISEHDLGIRVKTAEKFLKEGHKVRIEMVLRGRERFLSNFAKEKMKKFLEILKQTISYKIERELKKQFKGLTIIISKE